MLATMYTISSRPINIASNIRMIHGGIISQLSSISRCNSEAPGLRTLAIVVPHQNQRLLLPAHVSSQQIVLRNYANLPSKDKVENFLLRTIGVIIDLIKKFLASNEWKKIKATAVDVYYWGYTKIRKNLIDNPKVHEKISEINKKIEDAKHKK